MVVVCMVALGCWGVAVWTVQRVLHRQVTTRFDASASSVNCRGSKHWLWQCLPRSCWTPFLSALAPWSLTCTLAAKMGCRRLGCSGLGLLLSHTSHPVNTLCTVCACPRAPQLVPWCPSGTLFLPRISVRHAVCCHRRTTPRPCFPPHRHVTPRHGITGCGRGHQLHAAGGNEEARGTPHAGRAHLLAGDPQQ